MVSACIARDKKGPLIVMEYPGGKGGGMNTTRYINQVLEGPLKHFYMKMKAKKYVTYFQQDGAPSHQSKAVSNWLRSTGIQLFPHLASSPDISPIEPLWHNLKTLIRQRRKKPNNIEELKSAVRKAWEQISIETINSHINSMPDRIKALMEAKGGHTGF
ncbi:hypothetical protein EST38_g14332 [Candolleomyces aberdarensis]|uniref:Tc1-like transposase DDE domain-containing protein n=1 Tax=Candolleomyces aberdarensis TaxID=2316362 RepID=A0A4Q2CZX8_9AGAR|nr:hypothetical protein EST38_g14332 [Candolleomyces aberdarensis]